MSLIRQSAVANERLTNAAVALKTDTLCGSFHGLHHLDCSAVSQV